MNCALFLEHPRVGRRPHSSCLLALLAVLLLAGCSSNAKPKSDAELGLNPVQAQGRRVYDRYCRTCHEAYSSRDLHGPSLQHLYKKPYMPSGTPANDDRVREVILMGLAKMPGFSRVLDEQQVNELLQYLHTL
jgi:mono/diheme cytochrome c family protein